LDRSAENEGTVVPYNVRRNLPLAQQRRALGVYAMRKEILYAVENYSTVVIVGQTGCGKTTQIPQYLYEAGWAAQGRVVACTQPRRVAAVSIAARVAEEKDWELGKEVGYSIQFDDRCDPVRTRIKYLTDGMLLRQMLLDPLLVSYSCIMLDEAHERNIHTDIVVGLLKKVQRRRKDLKLIISSATLDARQFFSFYNRVDKKTNKNSAVILGIPGRVYPVHLQYLSEPCSDYVRKSAETILDIHRSLPKGDILAFLTGQQEIETVISYIHEENLKGFGGLILQTFPLYAGLGTQGQLEVFQPPRRGERKVVCSTNIAEASVTIDGVTYVVDCGFVKVRTHSPSSGMDSLVVAPVSQAAADQRAGRAGRVRPGMCFRLYPEAEFDGLPSHNVPEIQRTSLESMVLQLKALGIDDVLHFDFLSSPPVDLMRKALELLYSLEALDDFAKLTSPTGNIMAEFPVHPCITKIILKSVEYKCSAEILTIAACLSVQSVFIFPRKMKGEADRKHRHFAVYEGDHITLLNAYTGFVESGHSSKYCHQYFLNYKSLSRAVEVRKQLRKYMRRFGLSVVASDGDTEKIRKCIVSGFFANAAQVQANGSYRTVRGGTVLDIHPTSVLFKYPPEWVVFHEVLQTSKTFMRDVIAIDPAWLYTLAPHYYRHYTEKA